MIPGSMMSSVTRGGSATTGAHREGLSAADLRGVRGLALAAYRLDRCRDVDDVVGVATRLGLSVVDADVCLLVRVEQGAARILHLEPADAPAREPWVTRTTTTVDERPALRALLRDRRSWVAHTVDADGTPLAPGDPDGGDPAEVETLRATGSRSVVTAPVVVNDAVWGQLTLARRDPALPRFGEDDVATADVLAALVAGAVARVDLERQVRHIVADDPLTGLANRRVADSAADAALSSGQETCIVMCDVDGLKRVNDELGHDAGDDLLRAVADVLRRAADALPGATAARIGGDEFCLVTAGHPRRLVAETMALTVSRFPLPHGAAISYGVASTAVTGAVHARHLFRRADQAQYRNKRARARARARSVPLAADPAVTAERLVSAGSVAIGQAQTGVVPRLCAFAAAATETLGGEEWTVLARQPGSDVLGAVARGGSPSDAGQATTTLTVERDDWVVEIGAAESVGTGRQVRTALAALAAIAVLDAG